MDRLSLKLCDRAPMDPATGFLRWNGMMTGGALFLGVDGGGSRCRARIANAWRSIMRACESAAELAELSREDFARMHAGIGLAGLTRRGAEAALQEIAHPFASVR